MIHQSPFDTTKLPIVALSGTTKYLHEWIYELSERSISFDVLEDTYGHDRLNNIFSRVPDEWFQVLNEVLTTGYIERKANEELTSLGFWEFFALSGVVTRDSRNINFPLTEFGWEILNNVNKFDFLFEFKNTCPHPNPKPVVKDQEIRDASIGNNAGIIIGHALNILSMSLDRQHRLLLMSLADSRMVRHYRTCDFPDIDFKPLVDLQIVVEGSSSISHDCLMPLGQHLIVYYTDVLSKLSETEILIY